MMPQLPTVAEAGVPGFEATTWHGIVSTGGTPAAVINKLNAEINRILKLPDVNSTLTRQGAEVLGGTSQEFAAYVKAEIPKWTKVVKESGARPD
jgi:tripartite-type tricarboxylate transporter receptor subunit TctC